jgi:hypothetical protein
MTRTESPTDSRRTILITIATVIAVVGVGGYTLWSSAQQRRVDELLASAFTPGTPPARMLMCKDTVTTACVRQAADTSGLAVAWMPAPTGYHLDWISAVSSSTALPASPGGTTSVGGLATEHLSGSAGSQLEVGSGFLQGPQPGSVVGTASNGPDTATIKEETLADSTIVLELDWQHDGTPYYILRVGGDGSASTLEATWRQVTYKPPSGG